jgi:hypothetical protein
MVADAISLLIFGPATPHAGRGADKSVATEAVTDTLMRCRNTQRRYKNTLLFVAADEGQLATAREAMRRALAWESIGGDPRQDKRVDKRLQDQMTQAQLADARDKFKNNREDAVRAVRAAWSHVLFPVESTEPSKPFDLDHLALTARERANVPAAVYDKASGKGDGIVKEALGGESLSTRLAELWPADRPHLPIAVWRKECQHQVETDPAEMAARYGAETPVPDWRKRLVCSRRGSRQIDMVVSGVKRR